MAYSRRILAMTLLLLFALGSSAFAAVAPGYEYVPGQIIVKFKDGVPGAEKSNLFSSVAGVKLRDFKQIKAEHWQVTGRIEDIVSRLEDDPRVEYAQPNYVLYALEIPNDTRFGDLWGMNNDGDFTDPSGNVAVADADIDAVEAWDVYTGSSSVLVAVIDSGVDYTHPDLAANIWSNPGEIPGNGIDDDGNGFIDDIHGWDFANGDADPMDDNDHGTHCSGTIGGVGNNATGVAGVNWNVSIMGLKFLTAAGSGSTANAISCIEYATLMGVDVMSNSWGGGPYDAAMEAAIEAAYAADIFFVAAAGNSGSNNDATPHYPSNYPNGNVISVMATDCTDSPVNEPGWWSTSFGATTVDIAAPGLHIWSTTPGNTYSDFSGTSMATPHVAGAIAMLRGRFPAISVDDGKNLLMTVGNDPLPSLTGMCVSGARLNLLKLVADPDSIPPSAVIDLAAGAVASNWVEVTWTAPGDDGTVGTPSSYDMRYSTSPIVDQASWDAATEVTGEPDPGVYGTPESMQIFGLDVSTTYYFNVRAKDEYGNYGDLSNSPSATTLGPPTIGVAPSTLAATLTTGGTTTQTLTVTNTGVGVLDFSIPTAEYIIPAKATFAPVRTWEYDPTLKKGDHGLAPIVSIDGSGGPDAYGYNWVDSDAVGGPAYNWIDISTTGTSVSLSDDNSAGPFAIGFPFEFYGTEFTSFNIASNGFISFTSTDSPAGNGPVPSTSSPANMVALFWDDLNPSTGGNVYYYYDGTRLIVQYDAINHYDSGGNYTMQLHLYPGGTIEYHYETIVDPSDSATIGIQNGDGTDGLSVVFNSAYVHSGLAVRFVAISPWLSTSPNSGSLAAGASANVDVVFDATGLCGSSFDANLHIVSNDAATPDFVVPVGLNLIGTPDIQAAPTAVDFGEVYITANATIDVTVTNAGCADLTISGIGIDNADYSTTVAAPQVLTAGASLIVPVTFAPTSAGAIAGNLTFTSDDPDAPSYVVTLAGVGLEFPDISVDPTSLTETLPTGGTSTQTLTITNNGLGDLDFTIPDAEYIIVKSAGALPRPGSLPIELAKGEKDPRIGGPVVTGSGGPDVFGYRWTDSNEVGGPAYNWIDISGTGTAIAFSGDDQNLGPFPIGFSFPFYGNDFTEFRACTNGWLSFTSTATTYTNYDLPSASAPENLIAPFHDDLTFTSSGSAYYYYDGQRLIVQYQDAPRLTSGGPYTFQVHLYPSGRIEYHYKTMLGTRLNEATVGIQNGTATDGLAPAFNANYVADGLAVRFESVAPWLSAGPASGTILPGQTADITVGFDATGLCAAQMLANLHILSNDPDTPDLAVPVTLNLDGQPDVLVSATALDLGDVFLGQTGTLPLTIANEGCGVLNVTDLTVDNGVFTLDVAAPFTVDPGSVAQVNVTFTPAAVDTQAGTLTITTNDPLEPVHAVFLTGVGVAPGAIAAAPGSVVAGLYPNQQSTEIITVTNSGTGDLNFTVPSPDMYSKAMAARGVVEKPEFVEAPKDAKDAGIGALGAGGPDLFGYSWKDSDEAGGPAFSWIDISETGTAAITTGDDTNSGPFPIGFSFDFYGTTFTDFRVCTNGFMTFGSTLTAYTNAALPNASAPGFLIAPFWDDLNLGATGSGDIYYEVVGGNLVVMYDGVMPYSSTNSGTGPFTFEVILSPNGVITMQYLTLVGSPASYTVGIQDGTGTVGLQVAYNTAYLHDNMAIQFRSLPEWMTCTPTAGTIPAGGSVDLMVGLDSTDLELGLHEGMVRIQSDDPITPELQVPVSLTVSDPSPVADEILPRRVALDQNAPNPFNPMTEIRFSLPKDGRVVLKVYDVRGSLVRTLADGRFVAGRHVRVWQGQDDAGRSMPSGVYFYRLQAGDEVFTRRMTLLK
ncbi:S8 family serine peptidase [bacterium]|nr:S8 family serine peptidase [bacterium]